MFDTIPRISGYRYVRNKSPLTYASRMQRYNPAPRQSMLTAWFLKNTFRSDLLLNIDPGGRGLKFWCASASAGGFYFALTGLRFFVFDVGLDVACSVPVPMSSVGFAFAIRCWGWQLAVNNLRCPHRCRSCTVRRACAQTIYNTNSGNPPEDGATCKRTFGCKKGTRCKNCS